MSRWRIENDGFEEREHDYSAGFVCTNVDTMESVSVTITQKKGSPASDLVGACRALAQLMVRASGSDENLPGSNVEKLN